MAGDWIKLEHSTVDKPEVWRLAALLKITPEAVIGHLCRVWIWADQQATNVENGKDTSVDVEASTIDAVAHLQGFAQALLKVHWMAVNNGTVTFPNLQGFISETAKIRALRNRAQSKYRALKNGAQRSEDVTPPTPQRGAARKKRALKTEPQKQQHQTVLSDDAIVALGMRLGVKSLPGDSRDAFRRRVLEENERIGRK